MKYWRGQEAKINSESFGVGFVKPLMNSGLNSFQKEKEIVLFKSFTPLSFACLQCFCKKQTSQDSVKEMPPTVCISAICKVFLG